MSAKGKQHTPAVTAEQVIPSYIVFVCDFVATGVHMGWPLPEVQFCVLPPVV